MSTPRSSTQPNLSSFLAPLTPVAHGEVIWHEGRVRLSADCYLGEEIPPQQYISSVRSIVIQDDQVLVLNNPDEAHIMPGGRREVGETMEQTMRREVLEETGWEIKPVAVLGFIHFRHLTPEPPEYVYPSPYPYPDFVHLVYLSLTTTERSEARLPDDYEHNYAFRPILEMSRPDAEGGIDANQVLYLRAAIAVMGHGPWPMGTASAQ